MKNSLISATKKEKLSIILCHASFWTGLALMIAGFVVPPTGVINQSVLLGVGELLTFTAGIIGLDIVINERVRAEVKARLANHGIFKDEKN